MYNGGIMRFFGKKLPVIVFDNAIIVLIGSGFQVDKIELLV